VEIARLNNGQVTLSTKECNLADLLEEAVDRWKTQNLTVPLDMSVIINEPMFTVDSNLLRNVIINLLNYAAMRVTEGALSLSANDDNQGVKIEIQSAGKKSRDKSEMDSAMLGFITSSLIKLHGGKADEPQETEDGILLSFSLPR
jgi:K+-sensing histidine kinase KdpD